MVGGATVVVVVASVMVCVVAPALGTPTSGRFNIAQSCGDLREGEVSTRLQNLVVRSQLWLRTPGQPATLQGLSGQQCRLQPNTTFRVSPSSSPGLEVSTGEAEGQVTCTFPPGTDFSLQGGEVHVSCQQDKENAEREMFAIFGAGSVGLRPRVAVRPSPRALDFSGPGDTIGPVVNSPGTTLGTATEEEGTAEESATMTTPQEQTADVTTEVPTTDITVMKQGRATLQSLTDARDTAVTEGETTEDTLPPTGAVVTDGETTEDALPPTGAVVTEGETTGDTLPSTGVVVTASAPSLTTEDDAILLHATDVQNSSNPSSYRDGKDDHVLYFVGAGTGTFVLLMCIVAIACLVRRRTRKRVAEDNHESFFIPGSFSGSMAGMDYDGSYHNAQIMSYSGLEPEVAESFDLEEIVLKSQSSSSEYETPKCLREE